MKHMKKWLPLAFILLCVLGLAACTPLDPGYGNTVAYAGYSDDPSIADGALNQALLQSEHGHLPIFKLDTATDLAQFKQTYGDVLSMSQGWNEVDSLEERLHAAQWDRESFFAKKTLIVVYVPAISSSYRFGVQNISVFDGAMCVYVTQNNDPKVADDAMAGWFILIEVSDDEIRNYSSFDAVLSN